MLSRITSSDYWSEFFLCLFFFLLFWFLEKKGANCILGHFLGRMHDSTKNNISRSIATTVLSVWNLSVMTFSCSWHHTPREPDMLITSQNAGIQNGKPSKSIFYGLEKKAVGYCSSRVQPVGQESGIVRKWVRSFAMYESIFWRPTKAVSPNPFAARSRSITCRLQQRTTIKLHWCGKEVEQYREPNTVCLSLL